MRKQILKFSDYMTVRQAASFLGVSPSTLRNWDRQGKLSAVRNPINAYRLYEKETLEKLKAIPGIKTTTATGRIDK